MLFLIIARVTLCKQSFLTLGRYTTHFFLDSRSSYAKNSVSCGAILEQRIA